ncbi:MAG: hypothetical protein JWO08_2530 [Verrucomicrobiaceae bacterium]|nr:hypothetical protein [Verrucomicrobiaceae bacterium]
MFTTGGRGGAVVHVTNLNAQGTGSLADAVSAPNRIVVFDVSGIIDLSRGKEDKLKGGKIAIDQPGITIAGQTAPGEGICLKGGVLEISASNVIVRHLRSRRGFIRDTDSGDSIEVKPVATGELATASGESAAAFEKRKKKKEGRDKVMKTFAPLADIMIDHCSASWATDENFTLTHADRTTMQYGIASEGLDYTNSKQTPPNHSEGSLWGSSAPGGRSTLHHTIYAHNRLRNPRTTGGAEEPAVLSLYNSIVYNWSEYATHTGSERVHLNWLGNTYMPGPSTPADLVIHGFEFHGDVQARLFAQDNTIIGSNTGTADNRKAVGFGQKLRKLSDAEKAAMIVDQSFGPLPHDLQSAAEGLENTLANAGATLPARDAVDLRITNDARHSTGRIIGKETDLPESQRWPRYRSLPSPVDSDHDGIPDFWEKQFSLNDYDPSDSARLTACGYANVEHYFNNTDPRGGAMPMVFIAASVSRAGAEQPGEWRVTRTGDTSNSLTVIYSISGDAVAGNDFEALSGTVTFPGGKASIAIPLKAAGPLSGKMVVVTLTDGRGYHIGCPCSSLVVLGQ